MDYYTQIAQGYEELHKEEQYTKLRIIKENLVVTHGARILDIGCGPGWSAVFFENVIGIDSSNYGNTCLPVIKSAAEKLPFADHSFDIILCVTAVHHFDLDKALAEMVRVAKHGAVFVVTVLKKSPRMAEIVQGLLQVFVVENQLDGDRDIIYFLRSEKGSQPIISFL